MSNLCALKSPKSKVETRTSSQVEGPKTNGRNEIDEPKSDTRSVDSAERCPKRVGRRRGRRRTRGGLRAARAQLQSTRRHATQWIQFTLNRLPLVGVAMRVGERVGRLARNECHCGRCQCGRCAPEVPTASFELQRTVAASDRVACAAAAAAAATVVSFCVAAAASSRSVRPKGSCDRFECVRVCCATIGRAAIVLRVWRSRLDSTRLVAD